MSEILSQPRPEKTEAEIANQVGRITSKLIERANRLTSSRKDQSNNGWTHESEFKDGDTTISTVRANADLARSISVKQENDGGGQIEHSALTNYRHDYGKDGAKEVYVGVMTNSSTDTEQGLKNEKRMNRFYNDTRVYSPPESQLSVSELNKDGDNPLTATYLKGERDKVASSEVRKAAISTSAETLGEIRQAIVNAEQNQVQPEVVKPPQAA